MMMNRAPKAKPIPWHHIAAGWLYGEIAYSLFRMGHKGYYGDHRYFIDHFLSNRIYFLKNGLFHLPYYTPAFGGGLPSYANPQDMYFSIMQWFFNLTPNPMIGYRLGFLACLALAYIGAFKFFSRFGIAPRLATLGAFVFSLNSYHILQWVVGQINVQSYWIIPWILYYSEQWYSTKNQHEKIRNSICLALLLAVSVYAGGTFVFIMSVALALSLMGALWLTSPQDVRSTLANGFRAILICGGLLVGLTASKMLAATDFMRHFPRVYSNEDLGLTRILWIIPNALFNPLTQVGAHIPLQIYGWWENAAYVGLTTLLIVLAGLAVYIYREPYTLPSPVIRTTQFFLIWAAIGIPIVSYLFMGWNPMWFFLKKLPIFRSLHVPSRFVGAMPILIIGLAMAFLNDFYKEHRKNTLVGLLGLILVLDIMGYYAFGIIIWTDNQEFTAPKNLSSFKINQWVPESTFPETLAAGSGDVYTYEPLFGYASDFIRSKSKINPVLLPTSQTADGSYNINDPVSMIYPEHTDRAPWSLLPGITPQDQVERFLSFNDPEFYVPLRQKIANGVSLLSLIFSLYYLVAAPRGKFKGYWPFPRS